MFDVSTVTDFVTPLTRANAVALRRKPSLSMAPSTRRRVSSRTFGCPLMTRETVWQETPAAWATSWILAGFRRLPRGTAGGPELV